MNIYLVGGAVRDRLRGLTPLDYDYVVLGGSEKDLQAHISGLTRVGQGVPVFVRGNEQYTISTYPDMAADLDSRDLTINALAQDKQGQILAHPQALADLHDQILRPVRLENFLADPLRVFRAARFAATLPHFSVHFQLILAMQSVPHSALSQVAAERVGQEVLKACQGEQPGRFLRLLCQGHALDPWFRELAQADGIPAGPVPYHDSSVLKHTARVMDNCAGDTLAVWMALCHDLGKTSTPEKKWPHHFGHEQRGQALAQSMGQRLRLPRRYILAGSLAARWHMAGGNYLELREATKVRLLLTLVKADIFDSFFRLVQADGGHDHGPRAKADLEIIQSVRLPEKHHNRGHLSAEILLQLRCEALAKHV